MSKPELEQWWTAFPFRGTSYVFYCRKDPDKLLVQIFAAKFAGKKFMEAMTKGDKIVWERRNECRLASGAVIKCAELEEILDYEYKNEAEKEFQLPNNYLETVRYFQHGVPSDLRSHKPSLTPDGEKKPVKPQAPVAPAHKPKRKEKDGKVTAATVADELGVTARQLRGALRAAKIEKPEGGWAWDPKEAEQIKEQVKKHLK